MKAMTLTKLRNTGIDIGVGVAIWWWCAFQILDEVRWWEPIERPWWLADPPLWCDLVLLAVFGVLLVWWWRKSVRLSAVRRAVNSQCSCGGAGPGEWCQACEVWHALMYGCKGVPTLRSSLASAELCRLNGWGPGTVLEGKEGSEVTRITITAVGRQGILAQATGQRETSWTLSCRDWREVMT